MWPGEGSTRSAGQTLTENLLLARLPARYWDEKENAGYLVHAFEELGAWLRKVQRCTQQSWEHKARAPETSGARRTSRKASYWREYFR